MIKSLIFKIILLLMPAISRTMHHDDDIKLSKNIKNQMFYIKKGLNFFQVIITSLEEEEELLIIIKNNNMEKVSKEDFLNSIKNKILTNKQYYEKYKDRNYIFLQNKKNFHLNIIPSEYYQQSQDDYKEYTKISEKKYFELSKLYSESKNYTLEEFKKNYNTEEHPMFYIKKGLNFFQVIINSVRENSEVLTLIKNNNMEEVSQEDFLNSIKNKILTNKQYYEKYKDRNYIFLQNKKNFHLKIIASEHYQNSHDDYKEYTEISEKRYFELLELDSLLKSYTIEEFKNDIKQQEDFKKHNIEASDTK